MAALDHTNVEADGFTILGTGSDDTIDTTAGTVDFTINGDAGNDTITTGDGDTGTPTGGVTVNGGAGDDNITGGAGDDNLRGEGDIDTINGGAGADTIDGGAANDILNGDAGADLIDGGLGDDTIDGGADDDVIIGSAGTDTVTDTGGSTGDILQYNADIEILQSITETSSGVFDVVTDLGTTTITGIEFLWFNTTPFINIPLTDPNNRYGTAGNDNITGAASDGSKILAGAGNDTIDAGNGENNVFGGSGDDDITIGTGNDTVDGGSGTDTVTVAYATTDVTNYSNDGTTVTIVTAGNTDVFRNVETFNFSDSTGVALASLDSTFSSTPGADINGTAGDDANLDGTASGENINGLAGNDTITPGAGDDTVDGGDDTDTVVFGVAKADVTGYSETGGVVTITTAAGGTDTISNVENFEFTDGTVTAGNLATEFAAVNTANQTLSGTSGDDTLNGGLGGDTITGDGGNDTLNGGAGDDTITPGAGNDTVDGGADNDTVVFSINQSDVTSFTDNGGGSYTFVSSEGTDTISNVESFQFADGTVTEGNLGTAFELVNSAGLTRTGTSGDDTLTGGAFNDTITGDAGNDTLNGAAGDDTITPGAGDDTVDGGADNDTVVFGIAKADVTGYSESGGVVTITSVAGGTDTISNVENFQFTDGTVTAGNLATEFAGVAITDQTINGTAGDDTLTGALGNDTITPGAGDDTVDGAAGDDTTVFGFAAADLTALTVSGGVLTVVGTEGTDTLSNIESLQFSDQTVAVSDLVLGTTGDETVTGTASADIIAAGTGTDTINAGDGDDLIIGAEIGETIDGGAGTDTVKFGFASSDITSAVRKLDGSVELTTANGTATLSNVENVVFASEASVTLDSIVTSQNSGIPAFTLPDGNGGTIEATPTVYTGPVSYLEYELLGDANGNVVTASSNNDFLNLLGGDDAANGGDGDDVLDGGLGSNFLTGGNGGDVFFLDGRGSGTTWSTITDFGAGDSVNIWGWVDGTSRIFSQDASNGATGFEGATIHYDLDNDGALDTSITFTGLTLDQIPTPTVGTTDGGVLIFTA